MRKYSSASLLPYAFCNVFSLLCFNNLFFLNIHSIYFCTSALSPCCINILSIRLFQLIWLISNCFICVIVTCVFISLFYLFSCVCMLDWGFSPVYTNWCPIKTIPTVHNTIYLWNKAYISICYCLANILNFLT